MKVTKMRKLAVLELLMIALAIVSAIQPVRAEVTPRIKGVIYDVQIIEWRKDGNFTVDLAITFKLANYTDKTFTFPIGISFRSANLTKVSVKFRGEEIAGKAKLTTKGTSRVDIPLNKPINGSDWAIVTISIRALIAYSAKIQTDYPSSYTPIKDKVLNICITNYFYGVSFETDGAFPGARIRICPPTGWIFAYATSSITSKVATLDIRTNNSCVEFWNLDTSTVKPKSLSPGSSFSAEVAVLPQSSLSQPHVALLALLMIVAIGFFAYYYRDVYKYVERKVGG